MSAAEIRRKAVIGAAMLGARGVGIRLLGLAGNVALARLLVPAEFGTVALGLSVLTFVSLVSDGGLAAGLIRRTEEPTRADLRTVLSLQLVAGTVVAALTAGIGLWLGGVGGVVAIMMLALPVTALRAPGQIVLERRLNFGPLAAVEVGEVFAYYVWGVTAVALGLGVWGLATASVVKALTGTITLLALAPEGRLPPSTSLAGSRSLLAFGVRFQAVDLVGVVRDQGVNVGTAIIAGLSTLGLWTLAMRILQIPLLLFESLWRVSYPAMSQLIGTGENPKRVMERGVKLAAVATGLLMSALVSSTPALVPGVFGERWTDAAVAIPAACLGLQINGPISAAAAGYLFASGHVGVVLRSAVAQLIAFFAVAFSLLPLLGVAAVGLGYFAASVAEACIFVTVIRRRAGASLAPPLLPVVAIAVGASAAGWFITAAEEPTLAMALRGALLGAAIYVVAIVLLQRGAATDLMGLSRRVLRRGRST
ncbi:MAG TPA: oligosaccharide flippase family protein [Solirubrobacteraceae bacterium]|nr:oligosaccharide flippase family protein [Solirubrobacteraceae bacterium]